MGSYVPTFLSVSRGTKVITAGREEENQEATTMDGEGRRAQSSGLKTAKRDKEIQGMSSGKRN